MNQIQLSKTCLFSDIANKRLGISLIKLRGEIMRRLLCAHVVDCAASNKHEVSENVKFEVGQRKQAINS